MAERQRQFNYRWDRTWTDVPEDYIAFYGEVKIGRATGSTTSARPACIGR